MKTVSSISEQTRQYFLQESADLLQLIDGELHSLVDGFDLEKVYNLMRATHTLKGAAASVGLDNIVKVTHALEDIFNALCYDDTVITRPIERLLFEGYDCLQQLVSAQQTAGTAKRKQTVKDRMSAVVTIDRMSVVMAQLYDLLGDRLGQQKHLPSSTELGFDLAQSIFEMGVAQRIEALSEALAVAHSGMPNLAQLELDKLADLLQTQAEVFLDLGESLDLPGFEEIARLTLKAIAQRPDKILEIAPVALENFKSAQAAVLGGDRIQGGAPSAELQQFSEGDRLTPEKTTANQPAIANSAPVAINNRNSPVINHLDTTNPQADTHKPSWFKRQWQALIQPIGDASQPNELELDLVPALSEPGDDDSDILSNLDSLDWGELTPAEQTYLDGEPEDWDDPQAFLSPNLAPSDDLSLAVAVRDDASTAPPTLPESDEPVAETPSQESSNSQSKTTEPAKKNNATIRVSVEHLDQLSQAMGELLSQQNRQTLYNEQTATLVKRLLDRISQQQRQLNQQKDRLARKTTASSAGKLSDTRLIYADFDPLELDRYSDVQRLAQSVLEETVQQSESVEAIELFTRQSGQALEKQKRLLANTREILLSARMVPLEQIFQRFAVAVERLQARYPHKQIELVTKGGEVLVDRVIADKLYEPLLHLVRNAFDHGVETPERRLAQHKSAAGKITIEGMQQGRQLIVRVQDDGQGLDLDRIRRRAVETKRMPVAAAAALTSEQTIDLLFESGFSTKRQVDELSGRGVGLEAVREQVRSLKGRVVVSHEIGESSCFALHIPASLTIANLLLCQSNGRTYALLANAVEHILIPTEGQVRVWEGGKMLTWQTPEDAHWVPVNTLARLLNAAPPRARHTGGPFGHQSGLMLAADRSSMSAMPVILLRDQDQIVGIEVDQLLGEQELVINPLGNTVVPPDYLYGSSLLPSGQLSLVLDGAMLAKKVSALRHQSGFNLAPPQLDSAKADNNNPVFLKKLILTVDDSITTRNALVEALQKANYQVVQAQDGVEALQQLERYPEIEAILCDIEMPGMNGFEFLKARQRSPKIVKIPTIMLTSRGGTKHRLLTQELGATGYLTKPYLTPLLLKTVSEALARRDYAPLQSPSQPLVAGVFYE